VDALRAAGRSTKHLGRENMTEMKKFALIELTREDGIWKILAEKWRQ